MPDIFQTPSVPAWLEPESAYQRDTLALKQQEMGMEKDRTAQQERHFVLDYMLKKDQQETQHKLTDVQLQGAAINQKLAQSKLDSTLEENSRWNRDIENGVSDWLGDPSKWDSSPPHAESGRAQAAIQKVGLANEANKARINVSSARVQQAFTGSQLYRDATEGFARIGDSVVKAQILPMITDPKQLPTAMEQINEQLRLENKPLVGEKALKIDTEPQFKTLPNGTTIVWRPSGTTVHTIQDGKKGTMNAKQLGEFAKALVEADDPDAKEFLERAKAAAREDSTSVKSGSSKPSPKTKAEYDALPKGTVYIDTDGKTKQKQ